MSAPDEEGKTAAERMKELQDGAGAVSTGLGTMYGTLSSDGMQNQLLTLKGSGAAVDAGISSVNTGMQALYESLYGEEGLNAGLSKLSSKNDILNYGITALQNGADLLAAGIAEANAGSVKLQEGLKAYTDGVSTVNDGAQKLSKGAGAAKSGASVLSDGIKKYLNGTEEIQDGVGKLAEGTSELSKNSGKLNDGTGELVDGVGEFVDGMQEMLDGCIELNDGVIEFREDGIKKLADIYRTNIKSLDDSLMEIKEAAKVYKSFSGALDNGDNNVKFIIKTDSIETDED